MLSSLKSQRAGLVEKRMGSQLCSLQPMAGVAHRRGRGSTAGFSPLPVRAGSVVPAVAPPGFGTATVETVKLNGESVLARGLQLWMSQHARIILTGIFTILGLSVRGLQASSRLHPLQRRRSSTGPPAGTQCSPPKAWTQRCRLM
jgi:hypothetical protein